MEIDEKYRRHLKNVRKSKTYIEDTINFLTNEAEKHNIHDDKLHYKMTKGFEIAMLSLERSLLILNNLNNISKKYGRK